MKDQNMGTDASQKEKNIQLKTYGWMPSHLIAIWTSKSRQRTASQDYSRQNFMLNLLARIRNLNQTKSQRVYGSTRFLKYCWCELVNHFGKLLGVIFNVEYSYTLRPNSFLGIYQRKFLHLSTRRNIKNIHNNIVCDSKSR